MQIFQFVTDALGDASYVVIDGGDAAVVDPQRDVREYLALAAAHGATIRHVVETHVHNDYLSGGRELVAKGAQVVAPAAGGLAFPHIPVNGGDGITVGGVRLEAVAAPGHTYEHLAYLVRAADGTVRGAFTGGAILMAAAGRSDLLGPDHAEALTRMQWDTAHRLAALLPPEAEVLPTHGAGSFCSSTGTRGDRRGPLAVELGRNPVLASPTYEVFRSLHLSGAPIPAYYRYMAPINRQGPRVYGEPPRPAALDPAGLAAVRAAGVHIVDLRPRGDYLRGHVPGSVSIEESTSLLAYVSWMLPFNAPLALVVGDAEQAARVTVDLFRIGYEDVRGFLPFARWTAAHAPAGQLPAASRETVAAALGAGRTRVYDVRFAQEQRERPLPGAIARPLEAYADWAASAEGPALVVCESGQRATMVASFLRARGVDAVPLAAGGATDLLRSLPASAVR
jgi:hydroxyacylglutathione hydrolase